MSWRAGRIYRGRFEVHPRPRNRFSIEKVNDVITRLVLIFPYSVLIPRKSDIDHYVVGSDRMGR